MKTKNLNALILFSAFIILAFNTSCGKKNREDNKRSATDNALAEIVFNDITTQVDRYVKMTASQSKEIMTTCPTVTLTPAYPDTTFPKTLKIDYGSSCSGNYGVVRGGIVNVVMSGPYMKVGSILNVTLDNYTRNGDIIKGEKTIINAGKNIYGHTIFNINVKDGIIITSDGSITWNSTRQREWLMGEDTPWPTIIDDVYRISGTAYGTNKEEKKFKVSILKPLITETSCRWISEGSLHIIVEDYPGRTLDFGNGSCDGKATLTFKNQTYDIPLY